MDGALAGLLLQLGGLALAAFLVVSWMIWSDGPPGPPAH
jgi:hypothetical protein